MNYSKLPGTDLRISRIAMGCEPLGGTDWGFVDEEQAKAAVLQAVDLGINIFDTADVYGLGKSEELLSITLGARRHDVVIVTKFGVNWRQQAHGERAVTFIDTSPKRVVEALENSLRRLRIDCIPLYLVHKPDPNTPLTATLDALERCQNAGKIKYIGLSNFPAYEIRQAHSIAPISAVELQYNLIDRSAELDIFPTCHELNIGIVTYGSLAQGLLTGKYASDALFDTDDRRHRLPHFQKQQLRANMDVVARLTKVANTNNKSESQVAIRWVLDNPVVSCAIVGAKVPRHIEHNIGAVGWKLAPDDKRLLEGEMP